MLKTIKRVCSKFVRNNERSANKLVVVLLTYMRNNMHCSACRLFCLSVVLLVGCFCGTFTYLI